MQITISVFDTSENEQVVNVAVQALKAAGRRDEVDIICQDALQRARVLTLVRAREGFDAEASGNTVMAFKV